MNSRALFGLVLAFVFSTASFPVGAVTLTYAVWGPEREMVLYDKWEQEFQALYPDIALQRLNLGNYNEQIMVMAAGGVLPDVIRSQAGRHMDFAAAGIFRPLDDLIASDGFDLNDFPAGLLEQLTYRGVLYEIPQTLQTVVTFYNRDLYSRFGVAPPPETGWTWDQYLQDAQRLTHDVNSDGKIDVWGTDSLWVPSFGFYAKLLSFGAKLWSDDGTRAFLNCVECIETLQFLVDLANLYQVAPVLEDPGFYQGNSGIRIDGNWQENALIDVAEFEYGVAGLPKKAGLTSYAGTNVVGGSAFGISATTEHVREAWLWVKYLTGLKAQTDWGNARISLPTRRSVYSNPDYVGSKFVPVYLREVELGTSAAFNVFEYDQVNAIVRRYFEAAHRGEMPVQAALEEANRLVNEVLAARAGQ